MGYKTITFSSEVEKRTYVQGEFMGKYYGTINYKMLFSKTELYDIQIYEGEISNLKNDREHPKIINDIVYDAITSETQLTQKSFENVLVNLNTSISDFDSIKLAIREPKLEAVQIYDVVKDGNNTFGTLTCLVSGYLLEIETKYDTIEVETCDDCNQVLEDSTCNEITPTVVDEEKIKKEVVVIENPVQETYWKSIGKPFNRENRRRLWYDAINTGPGCIGAIGLLFGLLFLFLFGLPGLLTGVFLAFLYIIGAFFGFLPSLPYHWRQMIYACIGLLLLGLILNLFQQPSNYNTVNKSKIETSETNKDESDNFNNPPNKSTPTLDSEITSSDKIDILDIDTSLEEEAEERPLEQIVTLYSDSIDNLYRDSILSNLPIQMLSDSITPSSISQNNNSNNSLGSNPQNNLKRTNELPIPNTNTQQSLTPSNEALNDVIIVTKESTNKPVNNSVISAVDTTNQISKPREKIKRVPEIMGSTVFREGAIYVCKEDENKFYHLIQNCKALEDCTSTIYQINTPVAEREGYSLCQLEK